MLYVEVGICEELEHISAAVLPQADLLAWREQVVNKNRWKSIDLSIRFDIIGFMRFYDNWSYDIAKSNACKF